MSANLHEQVYKFLEDYRKENPSFRYWVTDKKAKVKLRAGYWFQGVPEKNEAFVGLYSHYCRAKRLRSINLYFKQDKNGKISFNIRLYSNNIKDEDDTKLLSGIMEMEEDKFHPKMGVNFVQFTQSLRFGNAFQRAYQFLSNIKPKVDELVKELGLEKAYFISEDEFVDMSKVIANYRKNNDSIRLMISKYKKLIRETKLKNEIFKWQRAKLYQEKPNITSGDFSHQIKSLDLSNLCYRYSISTIKDLVIHRPNETLALFEYLQNNVIDLQKRITHFSNTAEIIFNDLRPAENVKAYQDERAVSTYLAYYDANQYPLFKDSFYKKFCKLIGEKPAKKGYKYLHYIPLLKSMIENYIEKDEELLALKKELLDDTCHEDKNHLILAQDILYQVLDQGRADEDGNNDVIISTQINMMDSNIELNQILFGPPGTGKTYNTINKALEICGVDIPTDRKEVKQLFDEKVAAGQIVFTTFHQSMSYEDFVEGIKPQEPKQEGDPISYLVEDGIFKRICESASRKSPTISKALFASKYEAFAKQLPPKEEEESDFVLETPTGYSFWIHQNSAKSICVKAGTKKAPMSLALSELQKVFFEKKRPTYKPYTQVVIDEILKGEDVYLSSDTNTTTPYVLIIDEINRGNIAEIFGELITLLEADKRLGNAESLEIVLPYSKVKFGVPKNLFIIGTMNTADRSVEALDTALRRRFSFEEVAPNPDLIKEKGLVVDGIDLAELLTMLNDRIEKLLDRDHLIGHSYFLSVKTVAALQTVFYKNIIPLLQEHFFGDYGKIGLVLGEGFVQEKVSISIFAKFRSYESQGLEERQVYHIHDYRKGDLVKGEQRMNFKQAITLLLETV